MDVMGTRGRRLAVPAAAAAVLVVAALGALLAGTDGGSRGAGGGVEGGADGSQRWRTEYWRDTKVDVPAEWGWGGAPTGGPGDGPFWCGDPGAVVTADGTRLDRADPATPYVGRPIVQSDVCQGGIEDRTPQAPYVWIGAPIEPGTTDLGDGWVRETREVNGSTVSVAAQDPDLRERILESAGGSENCFSEMETAATVDTHYPQQPGTVCAYRTGESGDLELVYAAAFSGERAFDDAVDAAPRASDECPRERQEVVVLTGADGEASTVDTGCARVQVAPGDLRELTPATARPWATGGIPVVLTGPFSGDPLLSQYFIGVQG